MSGLFDKVRQRGEERFNRLTGDLLNSERFMSAIEVALSTKGTMERLFKTFLHTMSVASRLDVEALNAKLQDVDRKVRQLQKRLEALQRTVDESSQPTPSTAEPAATAPTAEPMVHKSTHAAEPGHDGAHRSERVSAATATAPASDGTMEAKCIACGKTFQKKSFNQRYCSAACRSGVAS